MPFLSGLENHIIKMPLYKTINFNPTTRILIWKITESVEELRAQVTLKPKTDKRLNGMKSEMHQRGFLSVRMLLQEAGFNDFDLHYDEFGKPYLNPNQYHTEPIEVSITHSHHFSAIIISKNAVGIDIEMQREKIIRIADKFINNEELEKLRTSDNQDYIRKLTINWGVKESIFKIRNEKGISFKHHISVNPFELDHKSGTALLDFENNKQKYTVLFEEFEGFTLVYAFEK
jgi:phosphopantetheinyl transferase